MAKLGGGSFRKACAISAYILLLYTLPGCVASRPGATAEQTGNSHVTALKGKRTEESGSMGLAGRADLDQKLNEDFPAPLSSIYQQCVQPVYEIIVATKEAKLYVLLDGEEINAFDVGVGSPRTPTPLGEYTIERKVKDPSWHFPKDNENYNNLIRAYPCGFVPGGTSKNPVQGYWIQLKDAKTRKTVGVGLHGTNNPSSIKRKYVSHGCIRMDDGAIKFIAENIPLGTHVKIRDYGPMGYCIAEPQKETINLIR